MLLPEALRLDGGFRVVRVVQKGRRVQLLGMPAEGRVEAGFVEGARLASRPREPSLGRTRPPDARHAAAQILVEPANRT